MDSNTRTKELHYNPEWVSLMPGQRYAISTNGSVEDALGSWTKCMEILIDDLEFHELIDRFGVFITVNPDLSFNWDTRFEMDGQRHSRLSKAVWDRYHELFEDYGLCLFDACEED